MKERLTSESCLLPASHQSLNFGIFPDLHVLMTLASNANARVERGATASLMLHLNRQQHVCQLVSTAVIKCHDQNQLITLRSYSIPEESQGRNSGQQPGVRDYSRRHREVVLTGVHPWLAQPHRELGPTASTSSQENKPQTCPQTNM